MKNVRKRHEEDRVETVEAVVGGVLGSLPQPEALILGRQDHRGRLRVVGHTSALPKAAQAELGKLLLPADPPDHPWPPGPRTQPQ